MSESIQQKIEAIFYPYIRLFSKSGTADENLAGAYAHSYFQSLPYFQRHPDYFGSYRIDADPFDRWVEWAFVQGKGRKTVVLIHHFDVVEVDDYGALKPLAFSPAELELALKQKADALPEEVREDLLSGRFIFGRGTADMKAGGAIQMAIIDELSQEADFEGNVLLVAVPDEENLSAGGRGAVSLMAELKARFDLDYVLMINSEPHHRKNSDVGRFTAGSIGKIMPFVYVRGILTHAGISQEGVNPLGILSNVIRRTEMSLDFSEIQPVTGEMAPLPTWLMAHDSKTIYDVSMPLSAFGYMNALMFTNRTESILKTVYQICVEAAEETTAQVNRGADAFYKVNVLPPRPRAWKTRVMTLCDYMAQQKAAQGEAFDAWYQQMTEEIIATVFRGEQTSASATWAILDQLTQLDGSNQPLVIVGLMPPFYPSVSYLDRPDYTEKIQRLNLALNTLLRENWSQRYDLDAYIMGVSDLSFSSLSMADLESGEVISSNMPLFGRYFKIPFRQLSEISMPCINIGPWGKDFHRLGERVLKEDLFERTPVLVKKAIQEALTWG